MADFYVPLATNLLGSLNTTIAKGPDLSWIGNLPDSYWAGQNQAFRQRNQDLFQNGVPRTPSGEVDYSKLAPAMLQAGGSAAVPSVMPLIRQQMLNDADRGTPTPTEYGSNNNGGYSPPVRATAPPSSATAVPSQGVRNGGSVPTLRQIAEANGVDVDQLGTAVQMGPDDPVDLETQRGVLTDAVRTLKGAGNNTGPPQAPGPQQAMPAGTRVAQAFGDLQPAAAPPSGAVAGARPVQTVQVQPDQATPKQQPGAAGADRARLQADLDTKMREAEVFNARANKKNFIEPHAGDADLDRSKAAYQAAQAIREQLLKTDPTNVAFGAANKAQETFATKDTENFADTAKSLSVAGSNATQNGLERIKLLKSLTYQPGFYSGPFSNNVQAVQQFRSIFGHDPNLALPGEAFKKEINDLLQEQIRTMGQSKVGRVLMAEVNIMRNSIATPENSAPGNRAQLEILKRVYDRSVAARDIADGVAQDISRGRVAPGQFMTELNKRTDAYFSQNKMFTKDELAHPQALGAPDAPANLMKMNAAQAQQWQSDHGISRGDPIRMPDGTYQRAI